MKVLFFTTAYDPQMEVQRVHLEFLRRLEERGCTVAILTSQSGRSSGAPFLWEEIEGIPVCRYALRGRPLDDLGSLLSCGLWHYDGFLTILRRYRAYFGHNLWPDILHIESAYPLGAVAALARRQVTLPYVITVRGADLFAEPEARFGYARYPVVRRLLRQAFRFAAATRATSPQTAEIVRGYGAPPALVHLVPRNIRDDCFPADLPAFRQSARAEIAGRHGLPTDGLIMVAAGRLLPIKGFDLLLQTLPAVVNAVPGATLLLCGASRHDPVVGDYRAYLERIAAELGVTDHVILTGDVPAGLFTRYLAAADLAVISSIREGSNKVLLEAAALGTPFVATNTSGTGDYFRDLPDTVQVPPGDVPALQAGILELLQDTERRQTLGRQLAQSCQRFRSDHVAAEMVRLYREIVAGAAEHPAVPARR
jgi:glycosyltransferase involved in cell wall biosynthesis